MYYDYSFCDDISSYKKELDVLDNILPIRKLVVANSTSLPFSFALARDRKVDCYYNNVNCLLMMAAFTSERKRFFEKSKIWGTPSRSLSSGEPRGAYGSREAKTLIRRSLSGTFSFIRFISRFNILIFFLILSCFL